MRETPSERVGVALQGDDCYPWKPVALFLQVRSPNGRKCIALPASLALLDGNGIIPGGLLCPRVQNGPCLLSSYPWELD